MRRTLFVVMAVFLLVPAMALARTTYTRPSSFMLTAGNPVTIKAGFDKGNYTFACMNFTYGVDQLDPDEEVDIRIDNVDAGGFFNPTTDPQVSRTICWTSASGIPALFDNGHVNVTLSMPAGSVYVTAFAVGVS